jgi:biopolymer transport protein ExbD
MQISSRKVAAVINVTPMIDILLVLLIAFMLLPDRSHGLPSQIPEPAPDNQPEVSHPLDAVLRIRNDRSIEIDSHPVLLAELAGRLKLLFAARPGGVLFVDGARQLEYADVASIIDIARGAGVTRIGIITDGEGEREHP